MSKEPELALDPGLLERFNMQGILKARFAYFEQHGSICVLRTTSGTSRTSASSLPMDAGSMNAHEILGCVRGRVALVATARGRAASLD
jgi:arginine repressor